MNPDKVKLVLAPFRAEVVAHRVALAAHKALYKSILTADKERILALVGPAGVGKSAVATSVQSQLIEHFRDEMERDPGFLPFIHLTARTGYGGDFSWKDMNACALDATKEPLIRRKTSFARFSLDGQEINTTRGLTNDDLSRALKSTIKNRRISIIFIEEASAMIDAAVNRNIVRQFNILKSFAAQSGIVIVMIGAYDLLGLNDGNGQIIRRAQVIHMPKYDFAGVTMPDSPDDVYTDLNVFADAGAELLSCAPSEILIDDDVFSDWQFMFIKSVGCFGIFRDWVDRAFAAALMTDTGRLTLDMFEREALSNTALIKLAMEAKVGEEMMIDRPSSELAMLMGAESIRAKVVEPFDVGGKTAPRKRKIRVGQRGPSRDPVGELHVR